MEFENKMAGDEMFEEVSEDECSANESIKSDNGYSSEIVIEMSDDGSFTFDVTQVPGYQPIPDGAPVWRKALLERKNKEAIEAFRKEIEEEQSEKAKWKNIPAWKKNLIETKEKKKVEGSEMDADERRRMEEENRRLQSMPTWKRNLVLKKRDG